MNITTTEVAKTMLLDDDFKTINDGFINGDGSYLRDILMTGFVGYDNFTDIELLNEVNERFAERDGKYSY